MRERRSGRRRAVLAAVVLAAVAALASLFVAGRAEAHPLGNFTVNRWARIEPTAGAVRITYVIDVAEIPSFQDRAAIDAGADAYARGRADTVARGLEMVIDDDPVQPVVRSVRIDRPKGDGGLLTTRVAVLLEAAVPAGAGPGRHALTLVDRNDPDRLGWREIIATAPPGTVITTASVPATDRSDQLRRYPASRLASPLDVRRASVSYETSELAAPAGALEGPAATRATDRLGRLLDSSETGIVAVLGLLGIAFLIGCGHALAPGHGKTVMAAYLVGTRGRPLDALLLGLIVSAMHTTSVLVLGLVLHRVDQTTAVERIYPALTVASGAVVLAFGAWLVWSRARRLLIGRTSARAHDHGFHDHDHDHDHHGDDHDNDHDHGHGHDHDHHGHGHDDHGHAGHVHGPDGHTHELPEGVAPLSKRGLVVLASSGGVVPSPSAVIVLVSALTLGRIELGLSLIVAFSIGLAATLSAVGLALVYGRRAADARLSARVVRVFPLLGAAAVLVLGIVLLTQGLRSL